MSMSNVIAYLERIGATGEGGTAAHEIALDEAREAARRIKALEAERDGAIERLQVRDETVAALNKALVDLQFKASDADRRVAVEREQCALVAEHFTGNFWDADENEHARRITDAIRSRSNDAPASEHGPLAQLVELPAHNGTVVGSSPAGTTTTYIPPAQTGAVGSVPEDYMLVPKVPTPAMRKAGALARHSEACDGGYSIVGNPAAEVAYAAMISASPQPPSLSPVRAGEFKPDWALSTVERVIVVLSLALPKHIPGWPGCTDEQMEAVATAVVADLKPDQPVEGGHSFDCDALHRVGPCDCDASSVKTSQAIASGDEGGA